VIFLERRNIGATWAWIFVLFFLPGIGFVLYVIFGQNLSRRKIYKTKADGTHFLHEMIQQQLVDLSSIPFHDPTTSQYVDLIYMNLRNADSVYTQDNEVEIYVDGKSKFKALFEDIAAAKDHIHLMYYMVNKGILAQRLLDLLVSKAVEGVEVRFLYDDVGSAELPKHFFHKLVQAGGEVAAFFPSQIPYINLRVNYRNHRKLVIIDGKYGYIGGFNIGDEYLGLNPEIGFWRDTHLKITGSSVLQMQVQFSLDWNNSSPKRLSGDPKYYQVGEFHGKVGLQMVASGPNHSEEQIENAFARMIYAAKRSIYLQTPYFIPDESIYNAIKIAALSGVNVMLMLPERSDSSWVQSASFSYLHGLLAAGVNCYLYRKGFLHAKTLVIDGKVCSVGTANMDNRSFKLNFEVNAFFYDSATANRMEQIFQNDLQYCRNLTLEEHRNRPISKRFKESWARLLSPIL